MQDVRRREGSVQVATVALYHYEFSEPPSGFPPGSARTLWFGPWDWNKKAVVVTAMPFDASTSNRELKVTDISLRTTPNRRPKTNAADKYVVATVRNVGQDTVIVYYIELAEIAP
jgi:hypothetical protein